MGRVLLEWECGYRPHVDTVEGQMVTDSFSVAPPTENRYRTVPSHGMAFQQDQLESNIDPYMADIEHGVIQNPTGHTSSQTILDPTMASMEQQAGSMAFLHSSFVGRTDPYMANIEHEVVQTPMTYTFPQMNLDRIIDSSMATMEQQAAAMVFPQMDCTQPNNTVSYQTMPHPVTSVPFLD